LLSPAAALGAGLVALGAVGFAGRAIRDRVSTEAVPLMGVMGAFVFAAQMINFTLPAMAGTSDHLVGSMLLAILLGPHAAVITMTGVLVVQCLIFQDGGLLALGANVVNMAVLPVYAGSGLWRVMTFSRGPVRSGRFWPATWTAAFVAVVLGSAAVCVEVGLSDRLAIPWSRFSMAMVGVHMLSGAVEGVITCAVLGALYRLYPQLMTRPIDQESKKPAPVGVAISVGVVALVVAGVLSWFASPYSDGLEWAVSGENTLKAKPVLAERVDRLQERFTPLPDYSVRSGGVKASESEASWPNVSFWTSFSGLLGVGLTLGLIWAGTKLAYRRRPAEPG